MTEFDNWLTFFSPIRTYVFEGKHIILEIWLLFDGGGQCFIFPFIRFIYIYTSLNRLKFCFIAVRVQTERLSK